MPDHGGQGEQALGGADEDARPDALSPHALPGGYVNLLGPDATARAGNAFGAGARRMLAVQAASDPDNVFRAVPLSARA